MRVLIALACLLITTAASADDSGAFVRVGMGVGRFRERQPAAGDSVLGAIAQTGYGLELSVGAKIKRFTVAATLLEHIVTFTDDGWKPTHPLSAESTSMTLATLGPSVDFHRDPRGGPYVGGLLGIASFANRTEDRPFGFGVAIHGGWDFATGGPEDKSAFGVGARLYYASMTSDRGPAQVFSPILLISYVYR